MTAYTPDLCDEVLVMRGPHAGGVGTVTDIDETRGFRVDGTKFDGKDFTRWTHPDDLTPAKWGTWRSEYTTAGSPRTLLRTADITDRPIEPVEMILESLVDVPWLIIEGADGHSLGVATRYIETVEVIVTDRRDSR